MIPIGFFKEVSELTVYCDCLINNMAKCYSKWDESRNVNSSGCVELETSPVKNEKSTVSK